MRLPSPYRTLCEMPPINRPPLTQAPRLRVPDCKAAPAHSTPRSAKRFHNLGHPSCGGLGTSFREVNVPLGAPEWRRAREANPIRLICREAAPLSRSLLGCSPAPKDSSRSARANSQASFTPLIHSLLLSLIRRGRFGSGAFTGGFEPSDRLSHLFPFFGEESWSY